MPDLEPRKKPRQARSRATVEALLEACARILEAGGMAGLTTNAIAERAGVGIGSLYEFFPNREAVLVALALDRLEALRQEVSGALDEALRRPEGEAIVFLLGVIVERVASERGLFRALLREAPFLLALPQTQEAITNLFALGPMARERAGRRLDASMPGDTWLISRMLASAVLDIALAKPRAAEREALVRELARLAFRMLAGRDPRGARERRRPT